MAHQSGYGGSLTIAGGGAAAIAIAVQEWSVRTTNRTSEAHAKGEDWMTKFLGPCEWQAQVACLVQDNATDGMVAQLYSGSAVGAVALKLNAEDYLGATSCLVSVSAVEDPLDGPARCVYTLDGNGAPLTLTSGDP